MFQNNPTAHPLYQFWVLDGFPVSDKGIKIYNIPRQTRQMVLASDGYPDLFPTLQETEMALSRIIEKDPLLMDYHKSTKGVRPGAESFDDHRTYVLIDIGCAGSSLKSLNAMLVSFGLSLLCMRGNLLKSPSRPIEVDCYEAGY